MTLPESLALEQIRLLRPVVAALRQQRADLADQLERAATSVALNLAEAGGRSGRDRVRVLRIASGEAREVLAALTVTEAWGYADAESITAALRTASRLTAVLRGLIAKLR